MKDNIDFCRKLFEKLIKDDVDRTNRNNTMTITEDYDAVDYFIILDYYTLKVLDLLEHWDMSRVNKYTILFKEFQAKLKLSNHPKALEMEVFFFTLNNVLIDRFEFVESDERKEYVIDYVKNLMEIVK